MLDLCQHVSTSWKYKAACSLPPSSCHLLSILNSESVDVCSVDSDLRATFNSPSTNCWSLLRFIEIWRFMWLGLQLRLMTAMSDFPCFPCLVFMLKRTRLGKPWPPRPLWAAMATMATATRTGHGAVETCHDVLTIEDELCIDLHRLSDSLSFVYHFPILSFLLCFRFSVLSTSFHFSWEVISTSHPGRWDAGLGEGLVAWIDLNSAHRLANPLGISWFRQPLLNASPSGLRSATGKRMEKVPWLRRV